MMARQTMYCFASYIVWEPSPGFLRNSFIENNKEKFQLAIFLVLFSQTQQRCCFAASSESHDFNQLNKTKERIKITESSMMKKKQNINVNVTNLIAIFFYWVVYNSQLLMC